MFTLKIHLPAKSFFGGEKRKRSIIIIKPLNGRKLENAGHAEGNGSEGWQVTLGSWAVPLVTNDWQSSAGDQGWPHCTWPPTLEHPALRFLLVFLMASEDGWGFF